MTDAPLSIWLSLLASALGGFTLADMDRALTAAEGMGATPVDRQAARSEVRALVRAGRFVEQGGRFLRAPRVLPPVEPKPVPVRPEPVVLQPRGQLGFGGGW